MAPTVPSAKKQAVVTLNPRSSRIRAPHPHKEDPYKHATPHAGAVHTSSG